MVDRVLGNGIRLTAPDRAGCRLGTGRLVKQLLQFLEEGYAQHQDLLVGGQFSGFGKDGNGAHV